MTSATRGAVVAARLALAWMLLLAVGYVVGRLITDASSTWEPSAVADAAPMEPR